MNVTIVEHEGRLHHVLSGFKSTLFLTDMETDEPNVEEVEDIFGLTEEVK